MEIKIKANEPPSLAEARMLLTWIGITTRAWRCPTRWWMLRPRSWSTQTTCRACRPQLSMTMKRAISSSLGAAVATAPSTLFLTVASTLIAATRERSRRPLW